MSSLYKNGNMMIRRTIMVSELADLLAYKTGNSENMNLYCRWKLLGCNPDINAGVRLNIRTFVTADVLREKPPKLNIKMSDPPRGTIYPTVIATTISPWREKRKIDGEL